MLRLTLQGIICLISILITYPQAGYTQKSTSKQDSLRTQRILEETLEEILEEKKLQEQNALQMEIDGLVVDQTITKIGKDFYDIFFSNWTAPSEAKNFTIIIKELPTPGLGTQVVILVNELEVFKQRLQPRYDFIEAMSGYAGSVISEYLINNEDIKAQLGGEDQQGTGIF